MAVPEKMDPAEAEKEKDTSHPEEANNPQDSRIRANSASHSIGVVFLFHYGDRNDQRSLFMALREDSALSVKKPRPQLNWVLKPCYFTVLRGFWGWHILCSRDVS